MVYKIINGVEPPRRKKEPGYYDKMLTALEKLEVDDRISAVKIEFSEIKEIPRALSKIYGANKHHVGWRYTAITNKEEKAIYVMKVSTNGNGNGRQK